MVKGSPPTWLKTAHSPRNGAPTRLEELFLCPFVLTRWKIVYPVLTKAILQTATRYRKCFEHANPPPPIVLFASENLSSKRDCVLWPFRWRQLCNFCEASDIYSPVCMFRNQLLCTLFQWTRVDLAGFDLVRKWFHESWFRESWSYMGVDFAGVDMAPNVNHVGYVKLDTHIQALVFSRLLQWL